ncbi:hypothetical protein N7474_000550 [Penicillium riverlandense]|uniref:uncharacterized protein n=1 Tax=Penicillium riverlandense TaxID=1903569 RepID=UPI0025480EA5|nr:uncharacterized protein N7474_000550 [Penicillium riverlandense]KAJ5832239.1 hypothetical protein N7474_000550 [Penicillium riverlandense]
MAFWLSWALWQKLSFVLGTLIIITLFAGFCVLAYNRWNLRRHAAAEAHVKEHVLLLPMLHKDEVPFGARALESGMQTEGIWISNPNTPVPSPYMSGTPVGSLPSSPALKPSTIQPVSPGLEALINSPMVTPLSGPSISTSRISSELELPPTYTSQPQLRGAVHNRDGIYGNQPFVDNAPQPQHGVLRGREKRASFHARIFGQSRTPIVPNTRETILDIPNDSDLSSGMVSAGAHLPTQHHRASRMKRLRRRSSEEFRRRMSQIFNENIHMNTPGPLPIHDPMVPQDNRSSMRKSILGPFRS